MTVVDDMGRRRLSATSEGVDQRLFRRALGQFATGIAVITGRSAAGESIGMTVSSFNTVSLDPPLVLFSIARNARSLPGLLALDGYAVNVLARGQAPLSAQFAAAGGDKWSNVSYAEGHAGAPLLHGAIAHFECAPYAVHDGGDHVIVVGRVLSASWVEEDGPLLFFRGRYHALAGD